MSRENIEGVRAQIDPLNRGDLETWSEGFHPDVEFVLPPVWPGGGSGRGREAAMDSMREALEVAGSVDIEVEEIKELDDGRLLVHTHVTTRGAGSGISLDWHRYDLMTMKEGKVLRDEIFLKLEQALETAGLQE